MKVWTNRNQPIDSMTPSILWTLSLSFKLLGQFTWGCCIRTVPFNINQNDLPHHSHLCWCCDMCPLWNRLWNNSTENVLRFSRFLWIRIRVAVGNLVHHHQQTSALPKWFHIERLDPSDARTMAQTPWKHHLRVHFGTTWSTTVQHRPELFPLHGRIHISPVHCSTLARVRWRFGEAKNNVGMLILERVLSKANVRAGQWSSGHGLFREPTDLQERHKLRLWGSNHSGRWFGLHWRGEGSCRWISLSPWTFSQGHNFIGTLRFVVGHGCLYPSSCGHHHSRPSSEGNEKPTSRTGKIPI